MDIYTTPLQTDFPARDLLVVGGSRPDRNLTRVVLLVLLLAVLLLAGGLVQSGWNGAGTADAETGGYAGGAPIALIVSR